MVDSMAEHVDATARDALAARLFDRRVATFGRRITFSTPSLPGTPYEIDDHVPARNAFASVSVTGTACSLGCDHCAGSLLGHMADGGGGALRPVMEAMIARGTRGFLVSGGAGPGGKVPLRAHVPVLAELKARHGITIVVHAGICDDDDIDALASVPVDGVMFDVAGSTTTLSSVCHLDVDLEVFPRMVRACKVRGIPVMPHVIAGLDWGEVKGEYAAIEMIARERPDALVLVVLMPVPGTPMEKVVVDPAVIDPVVLEARRANPDVPVLLGCAKPPGEFKEWLERRAVDCGFNGIAYPLQATVDHARARGLDVVFTDACCTVSGDGW